MSLLFADLAWAWRMFRVRRIRRGLLFGARQTYDDAIRPSVGSDIIAYPDAVYYIQPCDMLRAAVYVERKVPSWRS